MTALTQYARLECPGLWRPDPAAQRVEVVVSFGDSSLVISDRAGRALTHWSLAAVARVNPGHHPALYTPSAEATEMLEIDEETMVEAIEIVRRAVLKARPRSGRLRGVVFALLVGAVIAAGVVWVPDALVRYTATVLPEPTRTEIAEGMIGAVTRVARPPCATPRGTRALRSLQARLAPAAPGGLMVAADGVATAVPMPGGITLVGRPLVEDYEASDVLAGFVLAAELQRAAAPPLEALLRDAGLLATVRLLTTGHLPGEAYQRHAEARLLRPDPVVSDARLLAAFAAAEIASTPYAYARDVTGESVLPLIEGDPMRGKPVRPLLPDGDWIALQSICGG